MQCSYSMSVLAEGYVIEGVDRLSLVVNIFFYGYTEAPWRTEVYAEELGGKNKILGVP